MVSLTPLESDLLGELAWDAHFLGEIIGFIRAANPLLDDYAIYGLTTDLVASWTARGWLQLATRPTQPAVLSSIEQLLPYLERHGPPAVSEDCEVLLPEIELTQQAFHDVEWLRAAG